MLTLILNETGRGVGAGNATGVPGYVLGPNEVECTAEQYARPAAWMLKGGKLVAAPDQAPPAEPIADVTSAQAKIQLLRASFLVPVKESVAALGGEIEIWFNDARTWQRANPHVVNLGTQLGLSSDEIDDLFRAAAKIDA